jgi:hypothetical protein
VVLAEDSIHVVLAPTILVVEASVDVVPVLVMDMAQVPVVDLVLVLVILVELLSLDLLLTKIKGDHEN